MYVEAFSWPRGGIYKVDRCWHDKGMYISWVFNKKNYEDQPTHFKKSV